jgi:protein involved in polysaccharide export with SLBB domain
MTTMSKLAAAFVLISASLAVGQYRPRYGNEITGSERQQSRAEIEAEDRVSFSPNTILQILQQEPGLLLEVKKGLVRKAYEQGRLLDPDDLTDEAVFRLVRDDENVRILVTKEIEDRSYVRPKPTREEMQQQQPLLTSQTRMPGPSMVNPAAATSSQPSAMNQEDAFWQRYDMLQSYPMEQQIPSMPGPQIQPMPRAPMQAPEPENPARTLRSTSAQPQQENTQNQNLASQNITPISPDQLSQLLSVSSPASPMSTGSGPGVPGDLAASGATGLSAYSQVPDLDAGSPDDFEQKPQQLADVRAGRPLMGRPDFSPDRIMRHQANPYADVPSLYDLYVQASGRPPVLERFGLDIFRNGTGNLDQLPMDLPAGPEYVIGPGDGLNIDLWGGVSQRLRRVVDREGRLALPEVGAVQVSGRSLGNVQRMVQSVLRTQFRDVEADVSLARLRTVRVYVVGDVVRPGAYDISALSTPLNALYAAGGPTSRGSLRHLRHFRGKLLLQEIDAYDLLLHGVHGTMAGIQSGDTILVPPIGPEVTVQGMVRRPAIYEMGDEKNLSEVLQLAGGVLPSGTLRHVDVERVIAHERRTMLRLDLPESDDQQIVTKALDAFQVQDGDSIRISPILPYADQTVYLDGHVFHPGKVPFHEGMKITDVIHSYDQLLPEPSRRHAEIIRLQPPDYTPEVLAFNLGDAMAGKNPNLVLKPFDTIRIFGRYDFEDAPVITVSGEVRDPGDHITNGVTRLRDAVYLAGGVTPDAELQDAQIFRRSSDGKAHVISVDLSKALSGNSTDNILLEPKDRVFIHRNLEKTDPPAVTIEGEVARPGKYPLGEGMTTSELVRLAGGIKRSADTGSAELTHYLDDNGQKRVGERQPVEIAKALTGVAEADITLRDGDVLTIPQVSGWNDIGAMVTVRGEVAHPGTYGIHEGERLSQVLERVGGFAKGAYPYGAILERTQVRELEERSRAELISRVKEEGTSLKLIPETDTQQKLAKEATLMQWQTALEKLQRTPPVGRMVIHISSNVQHWANTPSDLQLRAGDIITIPKQPSFVLVDGAVYNPTAITFRPGKSAEWYLKQAGGPSLMANKKAVFVVRADGSVVGGSGGLWGGGALSAELYPGDMVMVPEKAFSGTDKWKTLLEASQLTSAVGIGIQVARSF